MYSDIYFLKNTDFEIFRLSLFTDFLAPQACSLILAIKLKKNYCAEKARNLINGKLSVFSEISECQGEFSSYFSQVAEHPNGAYLFYFSALPTTGGQVAEITYDVTFKLFYSQQSVGPVQLEKVLEKYQWITEEEI